MKTITTTLPTVAIASFALFATIGANAEPVSLTSLRGNVDIIANNSPVTDKPVLIPEDGFDDTRWESQPPSIPHEIHEYSLTLNENGCMNCHSEENYKKEDSVKVTKSHYYDRNGTKLKGLSSRRYFCVQCHTPQRDTQELVENTYVGEDD